MSDSTAWGTSFGARSVDQTVTYVPGLNCYLCVWTVPATSSRLQQHATMTRGRGYVALYRYVEQADTVFVLAIRSQREAGYGRA
jgi:hypothetical protein